jgi:hypothetical protein
LPVVDGSVTVDRSSNVRRQLSLTVADMAIEPDLLAALDPYGTEIVVQRGIQYSDGTTDMIPLGVFQVITLDKDITGALAITGADRTRQMIAAKFYNPRRQPLTDPFVTIPALAQEVYPLIEWVIDDNVLDDVGQPVNSVSSGNVAPIPPQFWDRERWDAMLQLADNRGCELFIDPDGALHIRQVDPITVDEVWLIDAAEHGVLITYSRNLTRDETYNAVKVTGESPSSGAAPVTYTFGTADPASPIYPQGAFGSAIWFEQSSTINTLASAERLARAIYASKSQLQRTVTLTCIPNPALDVGDIVVVRLPNGTTERHMVDSVVVPLDVETPMTVNTKTSTSMPNIVDPPRRPPTPPPGVPAEPPPDPVRDPPVPDKVVPTLAYIGGVDFADQYADQDVDVWLLRDGMPAVTTAHAYSLVFDYYDQHDYPQGDPNPLLQHVFYPVNYDAQDVVPGDPWPRSSQVVHVHHDYAASPATNMRLWNVRLCESGGEYNADAWVQSAAIGPKNQYAIEGVDRLDERADGASVLLLNIWDHMRYWNSSQSLRVQAFWGVPGEIMPLITSPDADDRGGIVNGRNDFDWLGHDTGWPTTFRFAPPADRPDRIVIGSLVIWEELAGDPLTQVGWAGQRIEPPSDAPRAHASWTASADVEQYLVVPDGTDWNLPHWCAFVNEVEVDWMRAMPIVGTLGSGERGDPFLTVHTLAPGHANGLVQEGDLVRIDWTLTDYASLGYDGPGAPEGIST